MTSEGMGPPFNCRTVTLVFDFIVGEVRLRLRSGEEIPAPPDFVLGAPDAE